MAATYARTSRLLLALLLAPLLAQAGGRLLDRHAIRRELDRQGRLLAKQFVPRRYEKPPPWATRQGSMHQKLDIPKSLSPKGL